MELNMPAWLIAELIVCRIKVLASGKFGGFSRFQLTLGVKKPNGFSVLA